MFIPFVVNLGEFLKGLFDNLTETDFHYMIIFLRTKILIYDNLTKTNFRSMIIFLRTKVLTYDNLTKSVDKHFLKIKSID